MYPTHAAVLHVIPKDVPAAEPPILVFAVRRVVEGWLAERVAIGPPIGSEVHPNGEPGELRRRSFGDGSQTRGEIVESIHPDSGNWAWQGWIEWRLHPDATCQLPRQMRTDVQMRSAPNAVSLDTGPPGAVAVTIREQLAFDEGVRPPSGQATMAPPCGLLGALFNDFRVFQGNIEWTRTYSAINSITQIDRLFEEIVDRHRTVPLLVCVGDESQGPPVDPADLGSALFGTARVFYISRPRLTGRFRERIGEKHRIGWNVLRLYRPGYSSHDAPGVHRFFRAPEIEKAGRDAFPQWLSSYIRREESFSIAPDAIVRNYLQDAESRQTNQARGLIDSLLNDLVPHLGVVKLESLRESVALITSALETAKEHRAEAEALATSYANDLDAIRHERHRLRHKIETLELQIRGATQSLLPDDDALPDPKSVKEAVAQVQSTIWHGEVVFHERVTRQVAQYRSNYDPVRVREVLFVIRDVARLCRERMGDGQTPEDYFREQGIHLKPHISDTARQQYRGDYELDIERDGVVEHVLMGPHVDLSVRHRIYWYHDKEASRFVIGHIGDHLRDASTK